MLSLSLPPSDPYAAHPVLLDSILLMGSYFARSPALAAYEGLYLDSCLHKLSDPIAAQSAVHDYVRASNLVIVYHLLKGRLRVLFGHSVLILPTGLYHEASVQMQYSAQLAIACGLHQIKSPTWRQGSPPDLTGFLPLSQDAAEHGEMIHTFWQVCLRIHRIDTILSFTVDVFFGQVGCLCHRRASLVLRQCRRGVDFSNRYASAKSYRGRGHGMCFRGMQL